MKSLFNLKRDIEKDARNWWAVANYTFYGNDISKRLSRQFLIKIKGKGYNQVRNLIKKEIKKSENKNLTEFLWLKNEFLPSLIEKEKLIISRLDKLHGNPFPVKFVNLYYSSVEIGYYGREKNGFWISIRGENRKKEELVLMIIHELMHLYFGAYYRKVCFKEGLNLQDTEDIKEAFTILINEEFGDVIKEKDLGYKKHNELRKFILKEWRKRKDFKKVLDSAIKFYKKLK
jgi:hypothetical protein